MIRLRRFLLLPAVAVLAATAADAQQGKVSPQDDISCAAWAAYIVGTSNDDGTQRAYGFAMSYFLGRYEGATGKEFEAAMVAFAARADANPQILKDVNDGCTARMSDFGNRLVAWGNK